MEYTGFSFYDDDAENSIEFKLYSYGVLQIIIPGLQIGELDVVYTLNDRDLDGFLKFIKKAKSNVKVIGKDDK